ncbi:MAG TPA: hypothetical protein VFQ61_03080 [Polyangiaceae bacterium]|nr:hypothetical protein [Polyangiaceae bacterium]
MFAPPVGAGVVDVPLVEEFPPAIVAPVDDAPALVEPPGELTPAELPLPPDDVPGLPPLFRPLFGGDEEQAHRAKSDTAAPPNLEKERAERAFRPTESMRWNPPEATDCTGVTQRGVCDN